ncbi:UNKNOWN [Stylonychia lemnae]|uniref:Transmembrane protein n=1 Tax=Stylonychia lemnae TaxID=5949 RepID=A0A078AQB6_STYLE|nr:UNKNOWN [Stylonychia lemnae]|eukprot:CDW83138.1 UNKNOWN [Stylonychia lemnae]
MSTNNQTTENNPNLQSQQSPYLLGGQNQQSRSPTDIQSRILNLSPYDIPVGVPNQNAIQTGYGGQIQGNLGVGNSPYGANINSQTPTPQSQSTGILPQQQHYIPQQFSQDQQNQFTRQQQQFVPQMQPQIQSQHSGIPTQFIQPAYQQPPSQMMAQNQFNQQQPLGGSQYQVPRHQQGDLPFGVQQQPQFLAPPQRQLFQEQQLGNPYQMQQQQQPGGLGIGLAPQPLMPPSRTEDQRKIYILDLIMKYQDILTQEERENIKKNNQWVSTGMLMGLISLPFSIYLSSQARRYPARRREFLTRILLLPFIPLTIMAYYGRQQRRLLEQFSDKYFKHLNDQDLDNFETYYHMKKNLHLQRLQPVYPPNQQMLPPGVPPPAYQPQGINPNQYTHGQNYNFQGQTTPQQQQFQPNNTPTLLSLDLGNLSTLNNERGQSNDTKISTDSKEEAKSL